MVEQDLGDRINYAVAHVSIIAGRQPTVIAPPCYQSSA